MNILISTLNYLCTKADPIMRLPFSVLFLLDFNEFIYDVLSVNFIMRTV